jgi:hypothetical protein
MKRNLTKRIVGAAALGVIAAAVSACGSGSGSSVASTCVNGICSAGLSGASINSAYGGCTMSFTGTASMDPVNGIIGQFQVTGEQSGMLTNVTGGYIAGRIGTDDTILEVAYTPGVYGETTISGILSLSAETYAQVGCSFSEVVIQGMMPDLVSGYPFQYILGGTASGQNVIAVGSYGALPISVL